MTTHHVETVYGTVMVDLHGASHYQAAIYADPEDLEYQGRRFGLHTRWQLDLDARVATNVEWLAVYDEPPEQIPFDRADAAEIRHWIVGVAFWHWFLTNERDLRRELAQDRLTHYVERGLAELRDEIEQTTQLIADLARELARCKDEEEALLDEMYALQRQLAEGGSG